jgi:hypothetical protein
MMVGRFLKEFRLHWQLPTSTIRGRFLVPITWSHGAFAIEQVFGYNVLMAGTTAVLQQLRERMQPLVAANEKVLPVRADLAAALPWSGLKCGSTVGVDSAAVLFALLGAATEEGSWVAMVGAPELGLAAAVEHGVVLARVVAIASPPADQAAAVVAALIDAVAIVVIGSQVTLRAADARRITARARERGGVIVVHTGGSSVHGLLAQNSSVSGSNSSVHRSSARRSTLPGSVPVSWPEAFDVHLHRNAVSFDGMANGHGHLRHWTVDVETNGRGAAARTRRATVQLTALRGFVERAELHPTELRPVDMVGMVDAVDAFGPVDVVDAIIDRDVAV